jgi:23S rRNA pseudouridine2605 synthase
MSAKPLLKALTEAGIGSRRRMAAAIKRGAVQVNGETAESFNHPVDVMKDRVSLDGQILNLKPDEIICLVLNKPEGVFSTVRDEKGRRTVLDILPPKYRKLRLYPAGRLDSDTTGLLILTNDGDLTYRLTHPRFELEKEYLVHINGSLKQSESEQLECGVPLEDGMTHPAKVKADSSSPPFNYSITIHEGRKRQVRRMFEKIRHPVLALKRVRIGRLTLGDIKEGEVKRLKPHEIKALLGA